MDQPSARILVMAKAPVPGLTKTRLQPLLGPTGCARLQDALIQHTVATAAPCAPVSVAVAGPQALVTQPNGDLGARLTAAVTHLRTPNLPASRGLGHSESGSTAHRAGVYGTASRAIGPTSPHDGAIVVVGTDCPQLGADHVSAAQERLAIGDDVVFGPARDGGYYLVALAATTPAAPVFALPGDAWGGPQVLALSLAAVQRAGLRTGLIDVENDLDTPADAALARTDPRIPPHLTELLRTAELTP